MKLNKISQDHYVVVDDSEIKVGDFVLSKLNEIVVFGKNYNALLYKKITHSTQPLEDVGLNTSMGNQLGFDKNMAEDETIFPRETSEQYYTETYGKK